MEYVGKFVRIFAQKDNGWMSGIFETEDDKRYNASGIIDNVVMDITYKLIGSNYVDPKYGEKLKIEAAIILEDNSLDFIYNFLSSGLIKGVGKGLAEKIIDEFGKDSLTVIEKHPDELMTISGISTKKAQSIHESYAETKIFSKLFEITNGKITPNLASKIIKTYGTKCYNIVKTNPYQLIYDIDGVGFLKADAIAMAMGIPLDSLFRIRAAIIYILKDVCATKGHCFITAETLQEETIRLLLPCPCELKTKKETTKIYNYLLTFLDGSLPSEEELIALNLNEIQISMIKRWKVNCDRYIDIMAEAILSEVEAKNIIIDEERIYWKNIYNAEIECAKFVLNMTEQPPIRLFSEREIEQGIADFELSNQPLEALQKKAVHCALQNRLCVITGGPGRGKTTVVNTIAHIWGNDDKLILLAPTGRASQKLRDATEKEAYTYHRRIYENRKVIQDEKDCLIIVDETSMIDLLNIRDILKFAENNQIIFIGDPDQLPSIGPGRILNDFIACPFIPTVKLEKCFRNEGSIVYNCDCVNTGASTKKFIFDENFVFKKIDRENLLNNIINEYMTLYNNHKAKDISILSPMKTNKLGSDNINSLIRDKINPNPDKSQCIDKFFVGDRIIITRNDYSVETIKNGETSMGIFNGDCGHITDVNHEEGTFTVIFDDGRIAELPKIATDLIQLAYAITIHKSQGSEYPYVIVPVDFSYYVMLKRQLLYTAISRAKKKVILLGDEKALNFAIRTFSDDVRNTYFKERISAIEKGEFQMPDIYSQHEEYTQLTLDI